jgi:hypothetical protein
MALTVAGLGQSFALILLLRDGGAELDLVPAEVAEFRRSQAGRKAISIMGASR